MVWFVYRGDYTLFGIRALRLGVSSGVARLRRVLPRNQDALSLEAFDLGRHHQDRPAGAERHLIGVEDGLVDAVASSRRADHEEIGGS